MEAIFSSENRTSPISSFISLTSVLPPFHPGPSLLVFMADLMRAVTIPCSIDFLSVSS